MEAYKKNKYVPNYSYDLSMKLHTVWYHVGINVELSISSLPLIDFPIYKLLSCRTLRSSSTVGKTQQLVYLRSLSSNLVDSEDTTFPTS